jgi:hypothetical protein
MNKNIDEELARQIDSLRAYMLFMFNKLEEYLGSRGLVDIGDFRKFLEEKFRKTFMLDGKVVISVYGSGSSKDINNILNSK